MQINQNTTKTEDTQRQKRQTGPLPHYSRDSGSLVRASRERKNPIVGQILRTKRKEADKYRWQIRQCLNTYPLPEKTLFFLGGSGVRKTEDGPEGLSTVHTRPYLRPEWRVPSATSDRGLPESCKSVRLKTEGQVFCVGSLFGYDHGPISRTSFPRTPVHVPVPGLDRHPRRHPAGRYCLGNSDREGPAPRPPQSSPYSPRLWA